MKWYTFQPEYGTLFNRYIHSLGHYLFYYGIDGNEKFKEVFGEKLLQSLEAIKYGIRMIAKDFIDRDEYNSYKHGLRIIPAFKNISFFKVGTMEQVVNWDLEESMSFFGRTKSDEESKIITKVFDPNRDYQMAYFCSNLISNMIYYRREAFDTKKDPKALMGLQFFSEEAINNCYKTTVEVQDLVYTIKKIS